MVNCWAVTTLPKTKYCQASAVVTGTYTANTDKDFIVKVLAAPNGKITSVSVNGGSPIPVSGTTPFKIGAGLSMAFDTGTPNIVGQSYGFEASPDSDCKNKPSVNC
jgi:hypothetical protein